MSISLVVDQDCIIRDLLQENATLKAELAKLKKTCEEFGFLAMAEELLHQERESALPAFRSKISSKMFME